LSENLYLKYVKAIFFCKYFYRSFDYISDRSTDVY